MQRGAGQTLLSILARVGTGYTSPAASSLAPVPAPDLQIWATPTNPGDRAMVWGWRKSRGGAPRERQGH